MKNNPQIALLNNRFDSVGPSQKEFVYDEYKTEVV